MDDDEESAKLRRGMASVRRAVPVTAHCPRCGGARLVGVPTFTAGAGIAARPDASDVFCQGCGYMGAPDLEHQGEASTEGPEADLTGRGGRWR